MTTFLWKMFKTWLWKYSLLSSSVSVANSEAATLSVNARNLMFINDDVNAVTEEHFFQTTPDQNAWSLWNKSTMHNFLRSCGYQKWTWLTFCLNSLMFLCHAFSPKCLSLMSEVCFVIGFESSHALLWGLAVSPHGHHIHLKCKTLTLWNFQDLFVLSADNTCTCNVMDKHFYFGFVFWRNKCFHYLMTRCFKQNDNQEFFEVCQSQQKLKSSWLISFLCFLVCVHLVSVYL